MKKRKLKLSLNKIHISRLNNDKIIAIKGGVAGLSEQVCSYDCPSHQNTNCDTDMCNESVNVCPPDPSTLIGCQI